MHSLVFTDLDDTLFQTLRKCGPTQRKALTACAYLKDGAAISYATPRQTWLWSWLSASHAVIPVTARNFNAFSRVDLPFSHQAVLNHGAVIVDQHGQLDSVWHQRMQTAMSACQDELAALWQAVMTYAAGQSGLKPRLIEDFGQVWYGVIKHDQADHQALQTLLQTVLQSHPAVVAGQFYCHCNDNNLAIIPAAIGKARAVRFLIEQYRSRYDDLITIGLGDSFTDGPFMALCDYALMPQNSQLASLFP
ncbi:MAG: hydrolase [Methylococcales bacterium]|nr:hydrolase [Methylococcales bacterium]